MEKVPRGLIKKRNQVPCWGKRRISNLLNYSYFYQEDYIYLFGKARQRNQDKKHLEIDLKYIGIWI